MSLISELRFRTKDSSREDISFNLQVIPSNMSLKTPEFPDLTLKPMANVLQFKSMELTKFENKPRFFTPLKSWKPYTPGTLEKFAGILSKKFPGLSRISEEELDQDIEEMRR